MDVGPQEDVDPAMRDTNVIGEPLSKPRRSSIIPRKLSLAEQERRLTAYHNTAGDGEAAEKLGDVSPQAFRAWRLKQGLPGKVDTRRCPPEEYTRRVEALHAHSTVKAAAESLGLQPETLRAWAAREQVVTVQVHQEEVHERRRRAYAQGLDDGQVAKQEGLTPESMRQWRMSNGVALYNQEERPSTSLLNAYAYSACDEEAAYLAGMPVHSFARWRRAASLPPHRGEIWHLEILRRLRGYLAADSTDKAADFLKIDARTLRAWLQSHGFPDREAVPDDEDAKLQAWVAVAGDEAAAERLRIAPLGFQNWRMRHGLPETHRLVLDAELA